MSNKMRGRAKRGFRKGAAEDVYMASTGGGKGGGCEKRTRVDLQQEGHLWIGLLRKGSVKKDIWSLVESLRWTGGIRLLGEKDLGGAGKKGKKRAKCGNLVCKKEETDDLLEIRGKGGGLKPGNSLGRKEVLGNSTCGLDWEENRCSGGWRGGNSFKRGHDSEESVLFWTTRGFCGGMQRGKNWGGLGKSCL